LKYGASIRSVDEFVASNDRAAAELASLRLDSTNARMTPLTLAFSARPLLEAFTRDVIVFQQVLPPPSPLTPLRTAARCA
jgi:hypothetical protein